MKYSLAIALLIGATSTIKLERGDTWWDKDTLPECPTDQKRTIMDDGQTSIVKWPRVGASCKLYIPEQDIVLTMSLPDELQAPPPPPPKSSKDASKSDDKTAENTAKDSKNASKDQGTKKEEIKEEVVPEKKEEESKDIKQKTITADNSKIEADKL